jgi:hypothetical protein
LQRHHACQRQRDDAIPAGKLNDHLDEQFLVSPIGGLRRSFFFMDATLDE